MKVLGKISFWPFRPFLGQKYIACGDKMVFSEVFGQFLPICCCCCMVKFVTWAIFVVYLWKNEFKILISKFWTRFGPFFGPPQRGWDLWFSLRPFVRSAEISKSVHRNFFIFGTKLGLPNATEVTFSDFARKILSFLAHFGKKMAIFGQFLKIYS